MKRLLLVGVSTLALSMMTAAEAATTFSTPSYITWIAPRTGVYQIDAWGAQGGDATFGGGVGGLGAEMGGEFDLAAGETLRVLVGAQGSAGFPRHTYSGGGGGGASGVWVGSGLFPLVLAGAGGGAGWGGAAGGPGSATRFGQPGFGAYGGSGNGGLMGGGGGTYRFDNGGGGGGLFSDGAPGTGPAHYYGAGGALLRLGPSGGYGGGGGPAYGGGGGGGASGGGGGGGAVFQSFGVTGGGGGGSVINTSIAAGLVELSGVRSGDGLVTITDLSPAVPEPTVWSLMIAGFGMIGSMLRRRRVRPA